MIEDIKGLHIYIYFDDLLFSGSTEEEYNNILKQVMERGKILNVTFYRSKLQIKMYNVKYFWHIFCA